MQSHTSHRNDRSRLVRTAAAALFSFSLLGAGAGITAGIASVDADTAAQLAGPLGDEGPPDHLGPDGPPDHLGTDGPPDHLGPEG